MVENFIFKVGYDEKGSRVMWKESAKTKAVSNIPMELDENDKDVINKAIQAGVDIPYGRENAMPNDVIIERIISKLTYSF